MTSSGGKVVGGEVTCGEEMVGGESSWWRDDCIPVKYFLAPKHFHPVQAK